MKKTALIVLDGWGRADNPEVSAIDKARTPFVDSLYMYRESTKGVRALSMALTSGLSARPHPSKTINAVFFIVSFGATNLGIIGAKKDPLVAGLFF